MGVRHPPPVPKPELSLNVPTIARLKSPPEKNNATGGVGAIDKKFVDHAGSKSEIKAPKFLRVMEVNTTSDNNSSNTSLHLPQIMGSFLPTINRKVPYKAMASPHSSWSDLTSQRKIKQVAPINFNVS